MKVAIVSKNITEEIINQLKVKHGKIKVITVVVEPAVHDIDLLTAIEKANLRLLDIDVAVIGQKTLPLEERLKPLEKLNDLLNDDQTHELALSVNHLSGKVVDEGEQYQFLVKRPDRGLIKMLLPLAQGGKIDDFADKAVKNLVVGGDTEFLEDGIVFMGVVSQLKEMIAPAQAFLSNA